MLTSKFIDLILGLFGRARVKLAEWPHQEVIAAAVATLHDFGAEKCGEDGTPAGEVKHLFSSRPPVRDTLDWRFHGCYTLGPKRLVAEVSRRVAHRLANERARSDKD